MSQSMINNFYKPLFIALAMLAFLILPKGVFAMTITFENEKWELNPKITDYASAYVKASDLKNTATKFLIKDTASPQPIFDSKTIELIESISEDVNQKPRSAKLIIENDWAKEFDPGQPGQSLDLTQLYIILLSNQIEAALPVFVSYPASKLSDTNNLGIKELVAVGESDFSGSPANRTVNIKVGAKKFNGLILRPDEEFSFNKYLGDVDEANGFLPELVIKKTGLTPELGGGLCQVSSTAFRAAMNAGTPIIERRNHSFAVHYYSPQGSDATIYPGVTDLRFTNDLQSHLLIRTRIEKTKLYFDFYGTKDNRTVAFEGPTQYDKKTDGSMKAIWTRTVAKDGQEKTQTFRSTYLPPALFTKTTESSIPNPTPSPSPAPAPESVPTT